MQTTTMNAASLERRYAEPAALQAVITEAYRLFGRHEAPRGLDACTYCCMSPELEREMCRQPLRSLTAKHFYEYNTAAKSSVQPADEILYLLPRMLELTAEGADLHHSNELAFDRLGRCPPGSLSDAERALVDRFALSHFAQALADTTRSCTDDVFSLLLMFDIGGVPIAPLLAYWARCEDPAATLHFVETVYWRWVGQSYCNPFATDRAAFQDQLAAWLQDADVRSGFVEKLMSPDFQRLAACQSDRGRVPFGTMVDGVFDQVA